MSKLHIANYYDAPRFSAKAGEDMALGMVIKISDTGTGARKALKVANADSALLLAGNYGVAFKVSADPFQVTASTANADSGQDLGSRIVTISSGDQIVEVRRGAILEYTADLLDDSLNPASGGTTPSVGDALAVKGAKFAAASASGAITSPVIARVYKVFGTRVLVELV